MTSHKSDCAVHNEPALKAGPCDCGAGIVEVMARAAMIIGNRDWFTDDHIDTVLTKTGHDEDCEDGEYCDFCWANRERAQARAALTAALDHIQEPSRDMCHAMADIRAMRTFRKLVEADAEAKYGEPADGFAVPLMAVRDAFVVGIDQLRKEALP